MKSSDHEDRIDRRPLRSEGALLLWQDVFPFAVLAQAIADCLEENLARVCHERDATTITTVCPVPSCAELWSWRLSTLAVHRSPAIWRSNWRGTAPVYDYR